MSLYLKKQTAVKLEGLAAGGRLYFDKADLVEFDYTREIERDLVEIQHKLGIYANKVTSRLVGYKGTAPVKIFGASEIEENLFMILLRGIGLKGTEGGGIDTEVNLDASLYLNPDDLRRIDVEVFADTTSLVKFRNAFHNAVIKGEAGKVILMDFDGKGLEVDTIGWSSAGTDKGKLVVFAGGEVSIGGHAVAGLKSFTVNLGGNIVVIPAYEDSKGVYRLIRSNADIYIEIDPLPDSNIRALLDDETEKTVVIKRHPLGVVESDPVEFITMTGLVAEYGHEWDNDVMRKKVRLNLSTTGTLTIKTTYDDSVE